MGVRRVDDPQHSRGYREIRSNAEMRKLMDRKIAAQNGACPLGKSQFTEYSDIVPDHIPPRGMGGAWRDIPTTARLSTGGAMEKGIKQSVTNPQHQLPNPPSATSPANRGL